MRKVNPLANFAASLPSASAVSVFFAFLALVTFSAQSAEPTQSPLITRIGEPPQPNVMVTIDDSGSMLADFIPDGTFSLYSKSITLARSSNFNGGFPNDPRKPSERAVVSIKKSVSTSDLIFQAQFRSPDVNVLWYNPNVRYLPWLKADGTRYANADPAAARWDPVNGTTTFDLTKNYTGSAAQISEHWVTASSTIVDTSKESTKTKNDFYPGLYYRLVGSGGTIDPTKIAHYTRYDINDSANYGPSSKPAARTDCVADTSRCTQIEERKNFANWFTYHRMREFVAKAAMSEVLPSFVNKMRAGWGKINQNDSSVDGETFSVVVKPIRPLDTSYLSTVLTGIQSYKSSGSTPLKMAVREVGRYFDNRTDAGNPWLNTVGDASSGKKSCRRSFHLLTTDGYYDYDSTSIGDIDSTDSTYDYSSAADNPGNYSPTKYTATLPFSDAPNNYSNTLADWAMSFWIRDLEPDAENLVGPIGSNIAFWQHLSLYGIGIGVTGKFDASTAAKKAAVMASLTAGTDSWPNPSSSSAYKADDLWHAAVNTGGDYYTATNVAQLKSALFDAFTKAVGTISKEAGVATVATTLSESNLKFVPEYKSIAWYGDVKAYALDTSGSVSSKTPRWQASDMLPDWDSRKLFTWGDSGPVAFTWDTLGASTQGVLGSADFVNFLRGDTSKEGNDATNFRNRLGKLLGDYVNAPPVLVKNLVNLSYDMLPDSTMAGTYPSFIASKNARSDGVLFVGGNGGLLHGFKASDGTEVFGYFPQQGLSKLSQLKDQRYGSPELFHRFYMDGSMIETDAYITPRDGSEGWTNMVLASMGAGGKSVVALTVPKDDPTALGASNIQWELRNDADLGYVMSSFRVGKIQNGGGWYAFIGNGPYNDNNKGTLLLVNLTTGAIEGRLTVPGSDNALTGVRLMRNANMEVYAAYAGDLHGNLWRFDFDGPSSSDWTIGFGGSPLFKAVDKDGKAQPITAAPTALAHPNVDTTKYGGVLVIFGTGKLIDEADAGIADTQTMYGVWDNTPIGVSSTGRTSPFHSFETDKSYRTALVEQKMSVTTATAVDNTVFFVVSANPVDWDEKKGWYLDMTVATGMRMIFPAQTILTNVYFTAIVPAGTAGECEVVNSGAYSFMLNAFTGGAQTEVAFDVTRDGVINEADQTEFAMSSFGDVNGDGTTDSKDGGFAGYTTTADGVDKLLSTDLQVVDDDDNLSVQFSDKKECLPSDKCKAGYCLVMVINTTDKAEPMCVSGDPCTNNSERCNDEKVIVDRIWKRLLSPPAPVKAPE